MFSEPGRGVLGALVTSPRYGESSPLLGFNGADDDHGRDDVEQDVQYEQANAHAPCDLAEFLRLAILRITA